MLTLREGKRLRILDFDIENRPLTYGGGDFTFGEITAIGYGWVGQEETNSFLLGEWPLKDILWGFHCLYRMADVVTGHFIRGHDLPYLNLAMSEVGLPPLPRRLASDTKIDLLVGKGISRSQESLSEMLGVEAPKVHMTQQMWRESNRLTPKGLGYTRARVEGDIVQHKQLRLKLIEAEMLKPPTLWEP